MKQKKQKKQKTKLVSHGAWGKCTIKHLGLVKESSPSQRGQGIANILAFQS